MRNRNASPDASSGPDPVHYALLQRVVNLLRDRPADEGPAVEQVTRLGLRHTRYGDSVDVVSGKAPTYRFSGTDAARRLTVCMNVSCRSVRGIRPEQHREDLAAWLIALDRGTLLSPGSLDTLWTPAAFNDGTVGQWALGGRSSRVPVPERPE